MPLRPTTIPWATHVWNPTTGCRLGCSYCYARRQAERWTPPQNATAMSDEAFVAKAGEAFPYGFAPTLHPHRLSDPMHRTKPAVVFVDSMGDLFDPVVPDDYLVQVWARMLLAPMHQFIVLTKQAERLRVFLTENQREILNNAADMGMEVSQRYYDQYLAGSGFSMPADNVWVGVTVENQAAADMRIPELLDTPAAHRFVSVEPMVGAVDLGRALPDMPRGNGLVEHARRAEAVSNALDWVIVGGESGPNARPMHPKWLQQIVEQAKAASVPLFFKQWGEWVPVVYEDAGGNRVLKITGLSDKNERIMGGPSEGLPSVNVERVGKKAAGRLFGSREILQWPQPLGRIARGYHKNDVWELGPTGWAQHHDMSGVL